MSDSVLIHLMKQAGFTNTKPTKAYLELARLAMAEGARAAMTVVEQQRETIDRLESRLASFAALPEPLRELPAPGTPVFWPSFGPSADDDMTEEVEVGYYPQMLADLLAKGLLHLTQEACRQQAAGMVRLAQSKTNSESPQ